MIAAAATPFVVGLCLLAAVLSAAAAVATREGERRLWIGIAAALALFAAHKGLGLQSRVLAHLEASARSGGWYGDRRSLQIAVVAVLTVAAIAAASWLLAVLRRASGVTRAALVLTTSLVLYALLGVISLHTWDGLVSRPVGGVQPYVVIEIAGPALIGLCALVGWAQAGLEGDERTAATRRALIVAFLLGWIFLPVAAFPSPFDQLGTPGTALPAAVLLTKAALLPPALLFVASIAGLGPPRWRPHWLDGAVILFCAVPLLHGRPLDALYLAAVWLSLWLLGRLLLAGREGRHDALALIALAGLALLPIALIEGATQPWLYGAVYGPHPFQSTGALRYVGFRPVGFFEDGNQYGMWTAMAALAAIELARTHRGWRWMAGVLVVIALAAQSAGAIVLLAVGAAALVVRPTLPRWLLPAAGTALLAGGAVYLSGVVPLDHLARDTRPGQMVLGAFRKVGRNSLPWRISQDQRALPLIAEHPLIGHGRWDWWRPLGRRPWGLPMLVIGQYGLIGLGLLALALLTGALATLWRGVRDERFALAAIVLLAGIDAALNSTIYFPAILLAAALAGARYPRRDRA